MKHARNPGTRKKLPKRLQEKVNRELALEEKIEEEGGIQVSPEKQNQLRYRAKALLDMLSIPPLPDSEYAAQSLADIPTDPAEFWRNRKPNHTNYHLLMRAQGTAGQLNAVVETLEDFKNGGLVPDNMTWTILFHACAENKDVHLARKFYCLLLESKQHLTKASFNALLDVYCRCGDMDGAFQLYEEVRDKGASDMVDEVGLTTLIRGCAKAQQYERAWGVFKAMVENKKKKDIKVDEITINLMMHLCGLKQQAERALALWKYMSQHPMIPTQVSYTSIIFACAGRREFAEQSYIFFEQMKNVPFLPDTSAYNAVLYACDTLGDVTRAIGYMNEMDMYGVKRDVLSYNHLFGAIGNLMLHTFKRNERGIMVPRSVKEDEQNIDLAHEWFEKMSEEGIQHTASSLGAFTGIFAKGRRLNRAWDSLIHFHNLELKPNVSTYNDLIWMYASVQREEEAFRVFAKMKEEGVTPNGITFSNLAYSCVRVRNFRGALNTIKQMRKASFSPSVSLVSELKRKIIRYEPEGIRSEIFQEWKELFKPKVEEGKYRKRFTWKPRELRSLVEFLPPPGTQPITALDGGSWLDADLLRSEGSRRKPLNKQTGQPQSLPLPPQSPVPSVE